MFFSFNLQICPSSRTSAALWRTAKLPASSHREPAAIHGWHESKQSSRGNVSTKQPSRPPAALQPVWPERANHAATRQFSSQSSAVQSPATTVSRPPSAPRAHAAASRTKATRASPRRSDGQSWNGVWTSRADRRQGRTLQLASESTAAVQTESRHDFLCTPRNAGSTAPQPQSRADYARTSAAAVDLGTPTGANANAARPKSRESRNDEHAQLSAATAAAGESNAAADAERRPESANVAAALAAIWQ